MFRGVILVLTFGALVPVLADGTAPEPDIAVREAGGVYHVAARFSVPEPRRRCFRC